MNSWTGEHKQAFEAAKRYLTESPILSSPKSGEELYMYLVDLMTLSMSFCFSMYETKNRDLSIM